MSTTEQATGIEGGVATVFVRSMDEAVRFYTETLGLALLYRAGDHWAQVDAGRVFRDRDRHAARRRRLGEDRRVATGDVR